MTAKRFDLQRPLVRRVVACRARFYEVEPPGLPCNVRLACGARSARMKGQGSKPRRELVIAGKRMVLVSSSG